MLHKFKFFIKKEHLFKAKDKILLAVSGGIDSVVMCELFYLTGYKFGIAHCNFKLRGNDSDMDEKFVKELSEKYKVPFFCKKFDTEKYAKENKVSVQMAARTLRFEWFEHLLISENYDYIATAHHLDDQIETFFINMLRGTGIAGLHGILPKQKHLIHPMLFTYKKDIEKFILAHKLDFRKDTSNQSIKYLRNKIRHKIIPLFEEINPDFEILLNKNIERIREAENIFKKTINKEKNKILQFKDNKILISISSLKKLHPVKTFLFEFLSSYSFNFSVIEDIITSLDNISGKQFYSSTHRLIKDREHLIITKIPVKSLQKDDPIIQQEYFINENEIVINSPVKLKINKISNNEKFILKKNKKFASLDYDKLKFPLKIRKWKTGDYFFPFGMTTRKKISDFFIDNKFSLLDKENTWLLCSDNKIIWIVGFRIDNRFKVTKKTKKIFQIMYLKN